MVFLTSYLCLIDAISWSVSCCLPGLDLLVHPLDFNVGNNGLMLCDGVKKLKHAVAPLSCNHSKYNDKKMYVRITGWN